MYYVFRQTWLAGADPTAEPDSVKVVASARTRETAEARAEALAQEGCGARYDDHRRAWSAKARDALHAYCVCETRRSGRRQAFPTSN